MSDSLLENLQHATESFRLEQEARLEQFVGQVERLFAKQQKTFEEARDVGASFTSGVNESRDDTPHVVDAPPTHAQTTYVFDTENRALLQEDDAFDPDAIDFWASDSDSSGDLCIQPEERTAVTGTNQREIQNKYASTESFNYEGAETFCQRFVNTRRLHFDSLRRVVQHNYFVICVSTMILANGVYIGIVADNNMHAVLDHYSVLKKKVSFDVAVPDWTTHVDLFFVIFFSIEIILRILAEELVFFFGDDWKWSWLDMILVTSSVVELLIVVDASDVRMLRLLRILRMVRSVRLLRGFRLFSKFRLLTLAIQASLVPLTWACVLLLCMLYVASLVFVNGVSDYLMSGESDQEVTGILYSYFSGVDVTMLTLFMCISGGVSWEMGVGALMQVHVCYGVIFILFIASMMLAALNIIAGIFVNDAIEMAQQDREFIMQEEAKRNQAFEKELKELFVASDADKSGTLTVEEFIQAFEDPEMQHRFKQLGVELNDAKTLFEMLDIAVTDVLVIEEFVSMCLRAKTLTRPVDVQSFMQQTRRAELGVNRGLFNIDDKIGQLTGKLDILLQQKTESATTSAALPGHHDSGRSLTASAPSSSVAGSLRTALLQKASSMRKGIS